MRDFGDFTSSQQQFAEALEFLRSSDFLLHEGHHGDVEVVVHVQDLVEILFLHFRPGLAHTAGILGEEHLVDDNVADVDFEGGQLLHQPVCFVQG